MAAALPFDEVRQNLKARAEQEYGARIGTPVPRLPWRLLNGIRKLSVPRIFVSGRASRGRESQTSLRRMDAQSFGAAPVPGRNRMMADALCAQMLW
jgi:hypothetical protein